MRVLLMGFMCCWSYDSWCLVDDCRLLVVGCCLLIVGCRVGLLCLFVCWWLRVQFIVVAFSFVIWLLIVVYSLVFLVVGF